MGTDGQIDFNGILEEIGGFGLVVFSFTGKVPDHRCAVPFCDAPGGEFNFTENFNTSLNIFPEACSYWSNSELVVPSVPTDASCKEYLSAVASGVGNVSISCDAEDLIYDLKSSVRSSISMEKGWVCGKSQIQQLVGASYMIGMLVGSFLLGFLSDMYGRKTALIASVLLVSIPSTIASFATNVYVFLSSVSSREWYVSLEYTLLIGVSIEIPFAIGELILGLEAYFVRDWVSLQLVAYTPLIALLGLWFIIPESPRWLLSAGKEEEARKVIAQAVEDNGKGDLDLELLLSRHRKSKEGEYRAEEVKPASFKDMFTPLKMMVRSMNMFYQWFSVTLCYYGLSFASTTLSGDAYQNFALAVFIEIPAYLVCILLMDCWGRRPILSLFQILSGVSCIIAGLLSVYTDSLRFTIHIFFFLLGKFGGSACFAIVYVYTAELFPTNIRNTAIGICSCIARIGGVFAFIIELLKAVWGPLPMILVGASPSWLTIGKSLPETKEDALHIERDRRRGLLECTAPWWYKKD
ncbi:Uncharacterized protein FKW44_015163 [Caligus rogercresseyi]|uniref:Major facilitator superfamily (MFS) profile domain-containing protein n=1 Tax=Caligus rogercresseyi TaxID=217165 RepID=A0A7T8JZJ1_CALRO|nr:Uncharacterized protein FKW44_015163 [Caligus rogercresseyi]